MHKGKSLLFTAVVLLIALFFWFDLGRYLTLGALQEHRQSLQGYYASHAPAVLAAFIAIYILQTALALPGAAVMSLAAGALFGTFIGTLCAMSAATIGAILSFLVTRYLAGDFVMKRFGARLEALNRELAKRGLNYLLFLRLVPLFPFFLINLAAGITRLPLRTFVIGTFFGIMPGAFVYVNAGASLARIDSIASIASPQILGSFALLGLFALLPALYSRITGNRGHSPQ
jgi:uncharacterized membrane protein YdjX (TVP38/TMEM64 family)